MEDVVPLTEDERRHHARDIRGLRESRGWTRKQLSEKSDVPEATIRDIESGSAPREDTLDKLLYALEVEITSFGIMSSWMANQIAVLVPIAQKIPPDRLPEVMADVLQILGRAARGQDVMDLTVKTTTKQTNVIVGDGADIDQQTS